MPRGLLVLSVAAALLLPSVAAGWAAGREAAPPSTPTTTATPAASTTTTSVASRRRDAVALIDPLRDADAPDPFVVLDGDRAWLFTTNTADGNVPAWTRHDGRLTVEDALPTLPSWAEPGSTWAPAVVDMGDHWVLAFTASTDDGHQCIGAATSARPEGPYVAQPEPLVCDRERGGSIDPSFVVDDGGVTWLLFKDDGNCCDLPTTLRSVPLTADGLALAGWPRELVGADQGWEGGLVEAPTMSRVGGRWLLLYSANRWDTEDYAVGAAWCEGPAGPCTKQAAPVLTAASGFGGPGGAEFVAGSSVVVFHAWPEGRVGYATGATRGLRIGRLDTTRPDAVRVRTP